MIRFLTWLRSILMAAMNTVAKAVVLLVLVFALLLVFSLARGDGLPANMVLAIHAACNNFISSPDSTSIIFCCGSLRQMNRMKSAQLGQADYSGA